jgi:type II secretory pathway component PulC
MRPRSAERTAEKLRAARDGSTFHRMRAVLVIPFVVFGCASSAPPPPKTVVQPQVANASSASLPAPDGTLRRSDVRQALSDGLGVFLQSVTVDVDHPVFRDGHFVGFRIAELKGPRWATIDLKPGDVVTAVNGYSVERPEQAQQAFLSLAVASELRVDYERDGQPRSMRLAITDD